MKQIFGYQHFLFVYTFYNFLQWIGFQVHPDLSGSYLLPVVRQSSSSRPKPAVFFCLFDFWWFLKLIIKCIQTLPTILLVVVRQRLRPEPAGCKFSNASGWKHSTYRQPASHKIQRESVRDHTLCSTQIQLCTGLYKFTNTQIQVNMYETKKEQGKQLASIAGWGSTSLKNFSFFCFYQCCRIR